VRKKNERKIHKERTKKEETAEYRKRNKEMRMEIKKQGRMKGMILMTSFYGPSSFMKTL
jgi:hypothetical protein